LKLDSLARRILPTMARPWPLAILVVAAALMSGALLDRALVRPAPAPAPADPAPPAARPPTDEIYGEAWAEWCKRAREEFANPHNTELSLARIVRARPIVARTPPAAALRHDQAIAQVLLAYPRVRKALEQHLGIYDTFLGTGLSNPVNDADYGSASLHEFLIANLPDSDSRVLTIRLKPVAPNLQKTVKTLIEENVDLDFTRQELKKVIVAHGESGNADAAMIRFAILNGDKYKGTIGRPTAVRVFASSLAEVWNLKVKDAADRSGYRFSGGDTFFAWVFVPSHRDEAVLEHLPEWMEEAQNKRP
jgi:hypothetical protein